MELLRHNCIAFVMGFRLEARAVSQGKLERRGRSLLVGWHIVTPSNLLYIRGSGAVATQISHEILYHGGFRSVLLRSRTYQTNSTATTKHETRRLDSTPNQAALQAINDLQQIGLYGSVSNGRGAMANSDRRINDAPCPRTYSNCPHLLVVIDHSSSICNQSYFA